MEFPFNSSYLNGTGICQYQTKEYINGLLDWIHSSHIDSWEERKKREKNT